jgi:diguanylate cyclase (GGDEF)-like protein
MLQQVDSSEDSGKGSRKQVVLQSVSLLTALGQGFAKAGVNDIVSLMVDDNVVFLDTMGRDDDLKLAIQAVLDLPPDKLSYSKIFLVLEHRVGDVHIVIEATVHSTFREGSYPMRLRIMGRVMSLRPKMGESASAYSDRIRNFVGQPDGVQIYRQQVKEITLTIASAMEAAFPGCPVRISKTFVQIIRLEPEQIQELSQLPLGGQIPEPQYRPAPEAGTTGGLDDRYEYFYFDPYHALLNWCLLDSMLTKRTWSSSTFRVIHPSGSILHKGDDLPSAIRGYGVNAYSVTMAMGLARPPTSMAQAPDHQHTEQRTSNQSTAAETTTSTDVLYDREYLSRQLDYEVKRAKRYSRSIGIAVIGIDDIGAFGSRYGDRVAMQLIGWVSERLESICRDADILCDLGNGMYAIIMPEADLEGGHLASARLRREISDYAGSSRPAQRMTVSIGVALLTSAKSNAARPLLAMAEQCLRKAQEGGANSSIVIEARL